ncbi:MAG: hypothetical protein AAGU27_06470 [Dehalobacterium sp.]
MASVCKFTVKFSYPVQQITVKHVYYLPKKRDFLRVKSHYRKHVFAPMIVMKSYHRGFYIPVAERSVNGCALSKRNHIRCSGREAAVFPFTANTTSSLTRATPPIRTLRSTRSIPTKAGPLPRLNRKAALMPSRALREIPRPATAAAAAGFTGRKRLTIPSAYVCAMKDGAGAA